MRLLFFTFLYFDTLIHKEKEQNNIIDQRFPDELFSDIPCAAVLFLC